jgi:hypothetical protein
VPLHPGAGLLRRARGRKLLEQLIGLALITPLLLAIPGFIVFKNWVESMSLKAEWTLKGPPCPRVARPSPVATRRHKPPMTFWYGDVRFTRSFGAVSCGAVPENPLWPSTNYRVCRFNNPGAVSVLAAGRTTVFEPGPGLPAAVTVRRGRASCVIAGGFQY